MNPALHTKPALRREVLARLGAMTETERAAASEQARGLLVRQPRWQRAESVLFYAPMPGELDVWPLVREALAAGKRVALPWFDPAAGKYAACAIENLETDIRTGHYGIREPAPHRTGERLNRLDFILAPGVAFDPQGRRLGRGKGYYDQLLAAVRGTTCGVAFDQQILPLLPVEPHDVSLNCILTPTRWFEF